MIEDNGFRSASSGPVSLRAGYSITPRYRIEIDVFNLLEEKASDIDYFDQSRLPGERKEGSRTSTRIPWSRGR